MRVGIVLLNWGIGGSEKRFAGLFNYLSTHSEHQYILIINCYLRDRLAEAGIPLPKKNVYLMLERGVGKFFDRPAPNLRTLFNVRIPGLNYLVYRFYRIAHFFFVSLEEKPFNKLNLDVVHFVSPDFAGQLGVIPKRVLSCQDTNLRITLLKNKFFMRSLHSGGYFDIASETIKKIVVETTGVTDDKRLRVNPCSFIDYTKTCVQSKELLIVFSGRFEIYKNPLHFVEVVKSIHSIRPEVRAIMMGEGLLTSEVTKRVKEYLLEDVIKVQFNPHPESILSRAMIYLSLQDNDNYHSQALMEAMACGCAIVATDVGETIKLVSDEVGFRVPLDANAIAEKVLWLLDHPQTAQKMGTAAREKVMREQTIERFSAYLEDLYRDAAASGQC